MRFKTFGSEDSGSCGLLVSVLIGAGLILVSLASYTPHGARLTQAFCPACNATTKCVFSANGSALSPATPSAVALAADQAAAAVEAGQQAAAAAEQQAQQQPAAQQPAAGQPAPTGWRAGRPDPGWRPALGERQLSKGIVSYGDTARTRRLLAKLLRGEPITAVAVGGSITWGQGSTIHGETDWSARLFAWIRAQFPAANHTLLNSGVPGVPSSYMSLCVRWHVPDDVDLVVVEYNINDGGGDKNDPMRKSHERLLRKLLAYKNRPAVIELTFYRRPDVWHATPAGEEFYFTEPYPFRLGGDDELAALATYYHLPLFSCRSLMWDKSAVPKPDPQYAWEAWTADQDHPNDVGHGYMADMVISFLIRTLDELDRRPLDEEDEQAAAAELVPPMYKDNWPANINTCLMGGAFRPLAVTHQGFEWINEGTAQKPKEGFVAKAPESVLEVEFSTNAGAATTPSVAAVVTYLASYEHMGKAEVSCASGCTCESRTLDGHISERVSQMTVLLLEISRSDTCRLRVAVLNETSSGEHKVKILGIIVSEVSGWLINSDSDKFLMSVSFGEKTGEWIG